MYNHILTKMSVPGFRLETTDESLILFVLEAHVCDICKMKESQVMQYVQDHMFDWDTEEEFEEDLNSMLDDCLPDEYDEYDDRSKINCLLDTVCGLEFYIETNVDMEMLVNED